MKRSRIGRAIAKVVDVKAGAPRVVVDAMGRPKTIAMGHLSLAVAGRQVLRALRDPARRETKIHMGSPGDRCLSIRMAPNDSCVQMRYQDLDVRVVASSLTPYRSPVERKVCHIGNLHVFIADPAAVEEQRRKETEDEKLRAMMLDVARRVLAADTARRAGVAQA